MSSAVNAVRVCAEAPYTSEIAAMTGRAVRMVARMMTPSRGVGSAADELQRPDERIEAALPLVDRLCRTEQLDEVRTLGRLDDGRDHAEAGLVVVLGGAGTHFGRVGAR